MVDDGVAEAFDAADQRTSSEPQPISMDLPGGAPAAGGFDNTFVADVAFTIGADGAVSRPEVLCTNPCDPAFTRALLGQMPSWSFRPTPSGSPAIRAAYRIIIRRNPKGIERIALTFARAS
jgi:hypothetical protein